MQSKNLIFCFSTVNLTKKQKCVNFQKQWPLAIEVLPKARLRSTCSIIYYSSKYLKNRWQYSLQAKLLKSTTNSHFLLTSTIPNKEIKTRDKSNKLTNFLQFLLYNNIAIRTKHYQSNTIGQRPIISTGHNYWLKANRRLPKGVLDSCILKVLNHKSQISRKPYLGLEKISNLENQVYNKKSSLIVPYNTNSFAKNTPKLNLLASNNIEINKFLISKKTKSYFNDKKLSSFFPYRKSFVCYWLLPFLGFVSYLSSNSIGPLSPLSQVSFSYKEKSLFFDNDNLGLEGYKKQKSNWTVSFNKSNAGIDQNSHCKSESIFSLGPWFSSKAISNNYKTFTALADLSGKQPKSLSSAFLIPQLNTDLKDICYKMSFSYNFLPSQISFYNIGLKFANINKASLQYSKFYPDKFYSLPLDQFNLFTNLIPLQDNVNNMYLYRKEGLLSFNTLLQSRVLPSKILDKNNLKNNVSFIRQVWPINGTKNLKNNGELSLLAKDSTKLINGETLVGIYRVANNKNFVRANLEKDLSGNLTSTKLNTDFVLKENLENKEHNQKVQFTNKKNPILSYKKASLQLDEVLKTVNTLKTTDLISVLQKAIHLSPFVSLGDKSSAKGNALEIDGLNTHKSTHLNSQYCVNKMNTLFNNKTNINIGLDLRTQFLKFPDKTKTNMLKLVDKKENLPIYFPSYLNKIFKNLNFLSINNLKKTLVLQNNRASSWTKPTIKILETSLKKTQINQPSFLEETISFLGNQKDCGNNATTFSKPRSYLFQKTELIKEKATISNTNNKFKESKLTNINDTTKKLSKTQIHLIVGNTVNNSFDSPINCPSVNSPVRKSQDLLENTIVEKNFYKLNHPLMFSHLSQSNSTLYSFNKLRSKTKELQDIKTSTNLGWQFLFTHKKPTNVPNISRFGQFSQAKNLSSIGNKKEKFTDNPSFSNINSINFVNVKRDRTFYSNYVNFLSIRFKHILKPFYPSIITKEIVKENRKNKRIEKIFRSYLSKKRKVISQKGVDLPLSRLGKFLSLKELVDQNNITALKKKIRITLWTRKNNQLINMGQERRQLHRLWQKAKVSMFNLNRTLNQKTNNLVGTSIALQTNKLSSLKYLGEQGNKNLANNNTFNKVSPYTLNSLLKNRVFILKSTRMKTKLPLTRFSVLNTGASSISMDDSLNFLGTHINKSYFDKLEKYKYAQKKHRRKKQQKETRRRKKRKRFYPRPIWSRYKMYKNFLQLTFGKRKVLKGNLASINQSVSYNSTTKYFSKSSNNIFGSNLDLDKKSLFRRVSLGRHSLLENLPLYSTNNFYQIKTSVLGELKRAFWKSYWLRSNLKPYLNNIKVHLKEIEKSSTKTTLYLNLKSLIMSFSGLNQRNINNGYKSDTRIWGSVLPVSHTTEAYLYTNLHFLNKQPLYRTLGKKVVYTNSSFNTFDSTIKQNKTCQNQNKWQLITQISEHNRIMYERIQNLIFNIRENLTLNGQFKARPFQRPGHQKLKGLSTLKQKNKIAQYNPNFWSKLRKTTSFFFTQSSTQYYGNFSKYRLYWAIHKSNLGSFKTLNKVKSLWRNTKNRDQSKANKTKKIFYDIKKKYDSFLNSSSIGEKFHLEVAQKVLPKNFTKTLHITPLNSNSVALVNNSIDKYTTNLFGLSSSKKIQLSLQLSERKLRQKEQKLRFLGISNRKVAQKAITKNRDNFFQFSYSANTGRINKFTNEMNYWWNSSKYASFYGLRPWKMQFVPSFNNTFSSSMWPTLVDHIPNKPLGLSRTLLPSIDFSVGKSSISFIPKGDVTCQDFTNKISILGAVTFIFHFCALISLITISQIRDLIKFLLILISKVSKVYLHFIYFSFHSFIDFTKNLGLTSLKKPTNVIFKETGLNYTKKTAYTYKGTNTKKSLYPSQSSQSTHTSINYFAMNKVLSPSKYLYYFFVSCLKKPFLLFPSKLSGKKSNIRLFLTIYKKAQTLYTLLRCLSINALVFSLSNFSFLTYTYFMKSLNFIETFVRSIYTFFEKPGELTIDLIAYSFLLEWSSDLSTTIPNTVDTTFSHSLTKFSRASHVPLLSTTHMSTEIATSIGFTNTMSNSFLVPVLSGPFMWTFSLLSGGIIQRRILSMYEIFVNIACRPDTDLISRQQKGYIFWDLWSDLLIGVAEDSNINVSELSNLKEEQNRLLEKLINVRSNLTEVKYSSMRLNKDFVLNQIFKSDLPSFSKKPPKKMTQKMKKVENITFFITDRLSKLWNPTFPRANFWQANSLVRPLIPVSSYVNYNMGKVNKIRKQNKIKAISWSTSQFLSYQGKDTELFIDLHPPKSFSQLTSIKYSESINQPIGLVLCQIFSGIFYKQIAKNILVVGPPGPEKSMLIQAIAGETELKMITDNAHRYAMVFRGVAVGIKLLRDVFEALTLQTPCIFLLEDIQAIGERRPFLISDDENAKGTESSIYQNRDEIHEKNQIVYQLTKHIISHYKKPYKGDFSLLIPTNHFCFELFNSTATNVQRSRATNLTPSNPFSLASKSNFSTEKTGLAPFQNSAERKEAIWNNSVFLASSLQLPKNQLLAPPATSPFSVLVSKEEKKLKPKKIVKEFPWAGLPGEQYANLSKATYSIRVKVALLADMVLSNLSVKLDLITDLLVIIDSVKGNRGFVVFATTHVPYILDPALRRPGRFDETLSLPKIPSLLSRWEIFKSNISLWQHKNTSLTKSPSSSLNYGEPFSIYPIGVSFSLWQTNHSSFLQPINFINSVRTIQKTPNSIVVKEPIKRNSILSHALSLSSCNLDMHLSYNSLSHIPFAIFRGEKNFISYMNLKKGTKALDSLNKSHKNNLTIKLNQKEIKNSTVLIIRVYNIVSKIFISLQQYTAGQNAISNKWGDFSLSLLNSHSHSLFGTTINRALSNDSLVYTSLYSSPHVFKQHLTILMAGQIGQAFAKLNRPRINKRISFDLAKLYYQGNKDLPSGSSLRDLTNNAFNSYLRSNSLDNMGLINLTGIDKTWRTATSLVFSFIQKRWIYQKKLIVPRLLDFGLEGHKTDIPSPPSSNILLPVKSYENYKRTFTYSQLKRKTNSSINDKIQLHQQQRLVKRLYKIPLKDFFRSEILTSFNLTSPAVLVDGKKEGRNSLNNFTSFSNASIILTPLQNIQQTPTSMNWYFRHRLLNRHVTYLSNQWWNGQLQEHNTERTSLSNIDWRYATSVRKKGGMGDLLIDFPDAEQYYNPKNKRWINTSGSWNSWFDFQKTVYQQYSSHYIFECLTNAYKCLDQNRELLDYYVINILEKGLGIGQELDELDILELFIRFYK